MIGELRPLGILVLHKRADTTMNAKTILVDDLRQKLRAKFPEAIPASPDTLTGRSAQPDIRALLAPTGGGKIIQLEGGRSSGKCSLLLEALAHTSSEDLLWLLPSNEQFPPYSPRFSVLTAGSLLDALKILETILIKKVFRFVCLDLSTASSKDNDLCYNYVLWQRLRHQAVRNNITLYILTPEGSFSLPGSIVSLRLSVRRSSSEKVQVTVSRSRMSAEGAHQEVLLRAS